MPRNRLQCTANENIQKRFSIYLHFKINCQLTHDVTPRHQNACMHIHIFGIYSRQCAPNGFNCCNSKTTVITTTTATPAPQWSHAWVFRHMLKKKWKNKTKYEKMCVFRAFAGSEKKEKERKKEKVKTKLIAIICESTTLILKFSIKLVLYTSIAKQSTLQSATQPADSNV